MRWKTMQSGLRTASTAAALRACYVGNLRTMGVTFAVDVAF